MRKLAAVGGWGGDLCFQDNGVSGKAGLRKLGVGTGGGAREPDWWETAGEAATGVLFPTRQGTPGSRPVSSRPCSSSSLPCCLSSLHLAPAAPSGDPPPQASSAPPPGCPAFQPLPSALFLPQMNLSTWVPLSSFPLPTVDKAEPHCSGAFQGLSEQWLCPPPLLWLPIPEELF